MNKQLSRTLLGLLAGTVLGTPAHAQLIGTWPSKPISIVMAGNDDFEITIYKEKLNAMYPRPFVLDHRPGGTGVIAGNHVAKSPADGHNLLFTTASYVVAPAFNDKLPYDINKDFAPVSLLSNIPVLLQATVSFPANNMREYIAYAKANPEKILWGTSGSGGIQHLAGEWMHDLIGSPATFVHYKNGTAATNDLAAGRIHVQPRPYAGTSSFVKAGKLKLLGVIGPKRDRAAPDLPTAQEAGLKDIDQPNFLGMMVVAGTDRAIINRLQSDFAKVVMMPDVKEKLEPLGNNQIGSTPEEFGRYLSNNVNLFKKLVKDKGIKADQG